MPGHALVVGGTGMLADVCLWLEREDYHVSVIARNRERLAALVERAERPNSITSLVLDYTDEQALRRQLRTTMEKNGPIELAVAWIHSNAPRALPICIEELAGAATSSWRLFHICGSRAYRSPQRPDLPEHCCYHQVILGFVLEDRGSRWLTNSEIAEGVIRAISSGKQDSVVGQLEPWEKRPS
ncbi:short-chain dehydrogenase [Brevibacillus humidisoli]|uniref:short-chain dehydrogenase n=1 Tax=Brevibacillus humidisoli TaxID=2895522 RepID=UPI001E6409F0|nr:short-chain dehydrogenase [Brevibacillus humidisoli]UFJ39752.1 short-chain dehydrogenase [Brevibacillus humidisoli]